MPYNAIGAVGPSLDAWVTRGRTMTTAAANQQKTDAKENPTSPKVIASAAGAGAGATVSSLLLWLLGITVWHQPATAGAVDQAMAAVPSPVSAIVVLAVTVASSAVFGWRVTDPLRISKSELPTVMRMRQQRSLHPETGQPSDQTR
jgi:hypothetical protein